MLVDLKFDDEIDALSNELVCVLQGCRRIIAIVKNEEIYTGRSGCGFEAFGYINREWHLGRLAAESKSNFSRTRNDSIQSVLGLRQISTMHKSLEYSIDSRLGNRRLFVNRFQAL